MKMKNDHRSTFRSETKCCKTDDLLISSFLHFYACGGDTSVDQFALKRLLEAALKYIA